MRGRIIAPPVTTSAREFRRSGPGPSLSNYRLLPARSASVAQEWKMQGAFIAWARALFRRFGGVRIRVIRHEPPATEAPAVGLGHGSAASRRALPSKSSSASSRAQWVPACSKARATAAATARMSGVLSRTLRDRGRTHARQVPVRSTRLRTSNGAPLRPPSDGAAAIRPVRGRALPGTAVRPAPSARPGSSCRSGGGRLRLRGGRYRVASGEYAGTPARGQP